MYRGVRIIAEVKTESPFGFKSERSWDYLFKVAMRVGDAISVHTGEEFGGSYGLIERARRKMAQSGVHKPILAKGMHRRDSDIERAWMAGAEYVLVPLEPGKTRSIPRLYAGLCFIEPHSLAQLRQIEEGTMVVWNSRDLRDGSRKAETFEEARRAWDGLLCQASYIRTVDDIENGANAVLVGTHLEEFADSLPRPRA